jgi:hypothetical protein
MIARYEQTRAAQRAPRKKYPALFERSGSRRGQRAVPAIRRKVAPRLPGQRCVARQGAFLAAYRKTGSIPAAAKIAGIEPDRHYQWLAGNAAYWQAFADVQEEVADALQDQVVERAMQGWDVPVVYRGKVCGAIRHRSDRLLLYMLMAWKPEEWGKATIVAADGRSRGAARVAP